MVASSPAARSSRLRWTGRPERGNECGEEGEGRRSSQRVERRPRRARGGAGDDESESAVGGVRGGRRWRRRRSRASGVAWLGAEDKDVEAELLGAAAGRGVAGGCGGSRRRRQ